MAKIGIEAKENVQNINAHQASIIKAASMAYRNSGSRQRRRKTAAKPVLKTAKAAADWRKLSYREIGSAYIVKRAAAARLAAAEQHAAEMKSMK
jgi:hypothetical protein